MTVELAPIEGADILKCESCDSELLVSHEAPPRLIHHADGSHTYVPFGSEETT